jgi:3-hydroxyisobutyrate dehydrogenase
MADDTKVAVLGTGIMGAAIARNLLSAGMQVGVWNRSREKAEPLEKDGAEVTGNPADTARGADFLLTMLADADVVEEAVGNGVLPALAEGGVWLQMSTVGEEGNERLAGHGDEDMAAVYKAARPDRG